MTIKVALIHEGKAYLPEVSAYEKYINNHPSFYADIVSEVDENDDYDIVWKFMGVDTRKNKKAIVIHEYNTITVGKNRALKDFIKKKINIKPDGRVYQTEFIKKFYTFKDNVPFIFRDQGVDESYFNVVSEKEYDFVYVGSMDDSRELDYVYEFFSHHPEMTLLLIGTPNKRLQEKYNSAKNIIYTGRMDLREIPAVASKAHYGLNYIPNVYPFNEQISTKLIEYCALNLKIVTLPYRWVDNFENENHGRFFRIKRDLSNLSLENLKNFDFITPDVHHLEWNKLLDDAQIIPFMQKLVSERKR